jgi:lysyl-tRNA synthetase class II
MVKIICNYFIIFLFFFIVNCEEKKNEDSSNLEITTKNIPTNEKVEYVFACMQGNENSQAYITKCSCSIDYIDEQMTYEEYVEAETIMSLRQIYGEKSLMFKNTPNAMEIYSNMQNILAEAEMECF